MQKFYINKNSTLPLLKMELINDGRHDYGKFFELIQNGQAITFTMTNVENGVKKIAKAPAFLMLKDSECNEEYYICYQWKARDTNTSGKYKGQFNITIEGKTLIVPIQDELIIYIQ